MLPLNSTWLSDFQAELLQFPHGRHDDQVDSLSQFLGWVAKRGNFFTWDMGDGVLRPGPKTQPLLAPSAQANVLVRDPRTGLLVRPK